MRISQLLWDDDTVEHLAAHGVSPEEAEQIIDRHPLVLRTRQGRYLVLGRTEEGRYLTVIVGPLGRGLAKIITARVMTDTERQRYLHR